MTESHERAEELFSLALSLPEGDRQAFLDRECGADKVLREELGALLQGHASGEFLESAVVAELEDRLIGTRIGRYKLLERIGEGGSGTVYHAEQEEPIRRRVALKIIKAGMDTREVVARFEAERQTLALMDHPNIARVFDCGATQAGRPYFVMELVKGARITHYCDERRLSVPERLELFVAVCRAIQHAHEKGIIHRDIKPSNILVTLYDGVAAAKVIDFGVAKATESRITGQTLYTSTTQFIGTPAYMSPEQADMATVDARSDVYSLGVLLYELLTGFTPFEGKELTGAGLEEMRRRMREVQPPRPSERLAAADPITQASLAERRATEPARLLSALRGGLDEIAMRCIARNSVDRYDTAVALAADVGAYLRREPLAAATLDRARTIRRGAPFFGRLTLIWAAAAVLALVAAAVLFRRSGGGGSPPGTAAVGVEFPHDPELQRAMKLVNGVDIIPEDFGLAEDIIKGVLSRRSTDPEAITAMALVQDAYLYRGFDLSQDRFVSARKFAEQAVQLAPTSAAALGALGIYLFRQPGGDRQRAREVLEQAIAADPGNPFYYRFRNDVLFDNPRISSVEAIKAAERTVELFPNDALSHYDLARDYRDLGRLDDMERELDRTIAIEPIANAIILKSRVALWGRGDAEEMRRLLDRVPARGRSLERWAIGEAIYAMASGNLQVGLNALDALPGKWAHDFDFIGPIALLKAILYETQGNSELARLQYEAAFTAIKVGEAADPANPRNLRLESWCLLGLGRKLEAKALLDRFNQTISRPYRVGFGQAWWFSPIPINFILGNRSMALSLLREAASAQLPGSGSITVQFDDGVTRSGFATDFYRKLLSVNMKIDPAMGPWRDDPEVKAILAAPANTGERGTTAASIRMAGSGEEFPREPDLKRAIKLVQDVDSIPEDLSLAEDMVKGALGRRPGDTETVTAMALVQDAFLYRGFDTSQARLASARRYSEQAAQLAPGSAAAHCALGIYLLRQPGGDLQRARDELERAIMLDPRNSFYHRFHDEVLFLNSKIPVAQAVASAEQTAELFPDVALVHYDLARHYRDLGKIEDMERELDRTTAIEPVPNAMILKARAALWVRGDAEAMRRQLDTVPARGRSLERWAISESVYALVTGHAQVGLDALEALPEKWAHDFDYNGPIALLKAAIYETQGDLESSRMQYEAALTLLKAEEADDPSARYLRLEAGCLQGLGRTQEAKAALDRFNRTILRPYHTGFGLSGWFNTIPLNLILGNRSLALDLLREAVSSPLSDSFSRPRSGGGSASRNSYAAGYFRTYFQIDPKMARWRDDPEVKAILAEPAKFNIRQP